MNKAPIILMIFCVGSLTLNAMEQSHKQEVTIGRPRIGYQLAQQQRCTLPTILQRGGIIMTLTSGPYAIINYFSKSKLKSVKVAAVISVFGVGLTQIGQRLKMNHFRNCDQQD